MGGGTERDEEGEAGSPLSREPNVGLDPRTLGSWPEPKADTSPTEPPRCPTIFFFYRLFLFERELEQAREQKHA